MNKIAGSLDEAVSDIADNSVLMIGGFGGSGAPIELIHALLDRFKKTGSPKNLTIINNNAGNGKIGIAAMLNHGMVRRARWLNVFEQQGPAYLLFTPPPVMGQN